MSFEKSARYAVRQLLLASAYFGAAQVGLTFAYVEGQATLVWPAAGVALAAFLFWGARSFPGIWLGTLIVNLLMESPPLVAVAVAAVSATGPLITAQLLARFTSFRPSFDRIQDVLWFLALSAAGLAVSATGSTFSLFLGGLQDTSEVFHTWIQWFLGDLVGVLSLAPFLLALPGPWRLRSPARYVELTLLFAGTIALEGAIFLFHHQLPLVFVSLLPLIWISLRFGRLAGAGMVLIIGAISIWGTVNGRGPFSPWPAEQGLFLVAAFLGVISFTNLILRAMQRERDLAESALRRSEAEYRAIVEDQAEFIVRWLPDGTLTFVNQAYARYFGKTVDQLIGKSFLPFIPEAERSLVQEKLSRITPQHPIATDEHHAIDVEGRLRWQFWSDRGIFDTSGRLIELQSVGRDIHDRKTAEIALRRSRDLLDQLFDGAGDAIYLHDLAGRILRVNRQACQTTGFAVEELQSMSVWDIERNYPDPDDLRQLWNRMKPGESITVEGRHNRKDGSLFPVEVRLARVDADSESLILAFARDITERKQAQEEKREAEAQRLHLEKQLRQSQKMEAIGTLAGGIAHDFNNILGAILGNVELARQDVSSGHPVQESLEQIHKASQRAAGLVNQMLTFSRQQEQQQVSLSLQTVVEEALQFLRPSLPASIEIQTRFEPDCPNVFADSNQIHQVIMNLCTNAYQAMQDQGGRMLIEVSAVELGTEGSPAPSGLNPGGHVHLHVEDSGPGMDEATRERIFEPFFTTKPPGEGTGLGLAVVHGIVKSHDGWITVDSEPGGGTRFDVYLPAGNSTPAPDPGPQLNIPRGNGQRILLVDDETQLLKLGSNMLRRLNYEAETFSNALDALKSFESDPDRFQAVITDLTMPQMSGTELAQCIQRHRPRLPIVITTGYSGRLSEAEVQSMGIREVLPKPANLESLAGALHRALNAGE